MLDNGLSRGRHLGLVKHVQFVSLFLNTYTTSLDRQYLCLVTDLMHILSIGVVHCQYLPFCIINSYVRDNTCYLFVQFQLAKFFYKILIIQL